MKTIKKLEVLNVTDVKKQKVAAYARVSHQDLLQSLSEQISYYSKLIQDNPSWEYAGVYFDNENDKIRMYSFDKIKMYK